MRVTLQGHLGAGSGEKARPIGLGAMHVWGGDMCAKYQPRVFGVCWMCDVNEQRTLVGLEVEVAL